MANKLDPFKHAVSRALEKLYAPEIMREVGQEAAEMIKLRTRLGSGVESEGAEKRPLKKLAEATKLSRKRMRDAGELHANTTPGKSNLTATGQLLDSEKVIRVSRGVAIVGPSGKRFEGGDNETVAGYVTQAGRPFNNLSKTEVKRLVDSIRKRLDALIGRELTR